LKSSLSWFMKKGIYEIQGAIWSANKASQNFFQKLGFEPVKLMMRKRL
jgi:RimJ/RimL family protein N-acetyltransferase